MVDSEDKQDVVQLIEALKDEDFFVRRKSAEALGEIGDERAFEPLIKAALRVDPANLTITDGSKQCLYEITSALEKIGEERAVGAFIEALGNEDWDARGVAAEALGKFSTGRWALIEALKNGNSYMRWSAAYVLGGTSVVSSDHPAVEPLIEALKDGCVDVRGMAAQALGRICNSDFWRDERAVEPLIELLKDEERFTRGYAAEALGRIGDKRAVEPLIEVLNDEKATARLDSVHGRAVNALGKIGGERAVDSLIEVLNDEKAAARFGSAIALGEIGDERAVEPLIEELKDEGFTIAGSVDEGHWWHLTVCSAAAASLGRIGDKRAVEPLIEVLKEAPKAREMSPDVPAHLQIHLGEAIANAAWALGEIGDECAVGPLIEALKELDEVDDYASILAAEALGKIGGERAVDSLIEALNDEDLLVRERAAEALGYIGDERAVGPLNEILKEDNLRPASAWARSIERLLRTAAEALEKIGEERRGDD